jgi:hypothetical protein
MVPKKYLLLAVAIIGIFFFIILNRVDGFQNAAPAENTDIKVEMCEIFRDTYNSLSVTLSKMEKSNIKVSDSMSAHLDSIKKQMEQYSCNV